MILHPVIAYLRFLALSVNEHGVHSPFVFNLVTKCFYHRKDNQNYQTISAYRKELLNSKEIIQVTDYGAGSRVFKTLYRPVNKIASNAGTTLKRSFLLNRLTRYLQCKSVLELGTSLGMGTIALATAHKDVKVTSVEGCPNCAAFARKQLEKYNINNCHILIKTFEEAIKVDLMPSYDLIYIDGNHSKEPTLTYFKTLLNHVHNDSVMIFDDIHWSPGMEAAWQEIITHQKVTVSIDTFQWGIVFFRKEQVKQHFIIRV